MKVLLICLILTIGCHSNEESNTTSTSPPNLTDQFESLKLLNDTTTTPSVLNITTEKFDQIRPVTTQEPIAFKKKPQVKVRKLKKIYKTTHLNNFYKVNEDNIDLNKDESKFIRKNPFIINSRNTYNLRSEFIDPRKNSSTKYVKSHDFKKDQSRVVQNFVKPDESSQRSRSRQYSQIDRSRIQNGQFDKNISEDFRDTGESRRNENYVQYSYKYKPDLQHTRTVPEHPQQESQNELIRGGRPTLPEIQNVIHTLDSQDSQPTYKSPKQNHIVEVTEVPLVFEHHYEGDYKNPQSNFVAHQYSYSPPADSTDEAYRLGKILSKNVVQKLESSQEPLREYVQDQQEVILAGYTHGVPSYSYVNINLNPLRTNLQNSEPVHPLLKYLTPEISPNSFSQEIQHFQRAQLNPYQFVSPQSQMQPIVVEEEEPRSEYGTTYLHAVGGTHQNNNQKQSQTNSDAGQIYHQSQNQQINTEESTAPKSPYSVNVQQHYVNVPKYTVAKYKQNKPQAIHEVEPPNLSGHEHNNNFNSIRYHIPSAIPTRSTELIRNSIYSEPQIEHETPAQQEEQVENPNLNFRLEGVIPSTKLVHYVLPQQSLNTDTMVHHPRLQMNPSRPYWRKPQVMKLVRLPERNKYQQEEQNHQVHYQSYRNPGAESHTRNQQLYQSLAEDYSSPVQMHQVSMNQQHDGYSGNIMRLVPQQTAQQHEITHQFSGRPIDVAHVYSTNQNQAEETSASMYTQGTYQQQSPDENSVRYQNSEEQNYPNERPDKNSNLGNVEIVKSISQYFPQQQDENTRENAMYGKPMVMEDANIGSELPKGYLSFQQQRNHPRTPNMLRVENTRHVMPLVRYRNRENFDSRSRIMNPRIRRLVSDLLRDNSRRKSVYVVMTENE